MRQQNIQHTIPPHAGGLTAHEHLQHLLQKEARNRPGRRSDVPLNRANWNATARPALRPTSGPVAVNNASPDKEPAAQPAKTREQTAFEAKRAKQAGLLLEATRNFCALKRPSAKEVSVFREFFYRLAGGCSRAEMRSLSIALASNPYAPRPVILYLALDRVDVAAPVLLLSPVLGEIDIVELARRLTPEHVEVMCRRDGLMPAAIVALLAHGGEKAAKLLVRNGHSEKTGFAKETESDENIAAETHATEVETSETVAVVAGIAENNAAEAEAVGGKRAENETAKAKPVAIKRAARPDLEFTAEEVRQELLRLAGKGGRMGRASTPPKPIIARKPEPAPSPQPSPILDGNFASRLIDRARSGEKKKVAAEMASAAGCLPSTVEDLIIRDSLEPISVLMKGLGIDDLSASQLILLLKPEIGRSREDAARARGLYRRLNGETCRQFVETLGNMSGDRRPETITAPASGNLPEVLADAGALAGAISERRREIASSVHLRPEARLEARPAMPVGSERRFGKANSAGWAPTPPR